MTIKTGQPVRLGCVYDARALGAFSVRPKKGEAKIPFAVPCSIHFGWIDNRCPQFSKDGESVRYSVRGMNGQFIRAEDGKREAELTPNQAALLQLADAWRVQKHFGR